MFGFGYIYDFFFICVPCDFPFYADLLNDRKRFHKQRGPYDFFENDSFRIKKIETIKKAVESFLCTKCCN